MRHPFSRRISRRGKDRQTSPPREFQVCPLPDRQHGPSSAVPRCGPFGKQLNLERSERDQAGGRTRIATCDRPDSVAGQRHCPNPCRQRGGRHFPVHHREKSKAGLQDVFPDSGAWPSGCRSRSRARLSKAGGRVCGAGPDNPPGSSATRGRNDEPIPERGFKPHGRGAALGHEVALQAIPVAHPTTREVVRNRGVAEPALCRSDAADVCSLFPVGSVRCEVLRHQTGRNGSGMFAGRNPPATPVLPRGQLVLAHPPRHAMPPKLRTHREPGRAIAIPQTRPSTLLQSAAVTLPEAGLPGQKHTCPRAHEWTPAPHSGLRLWDAETGTVGFVLARTRNHRCSGSA